MPAQISRPSSAIFLAETGGRVSDAQVYYRAMLPAWGLAELGLRTGVFPEVGPDHAGRLIGIDVGRGVVSEAPDVMVLRRPSRDVSEWITTARIAGQRVYVDVDDDVWNLRANASDPASFTPADRDELEKNLAAATGLLASTPAIADVVRARVLGLPVFVCPPAVLTPPLGKRRSVATLRVGWMGHTDYRGVDLACWRDELADALEGRNACFVHVGHGVGRRDVADILGPSFPVPIARVPWVEISELAGLLHHHLDVMVHPQEAGPFNEARSVTSGLAAAAAGVPLAYTETGPYSEAFGPSPTVGELVSSRQLRRERRAWGYRVAGRHHPRVMARRYLEAFGGD